MFELNLTIQEQCHTIPTRKFKYIGVVIDNHIQYDLHIKFLPKKTTFYIMQIQEYFAKYEHKKNL